MHHLSKTLLLALSLAIPCHAHARSDERSTAAPATVEVQGFMIEGAGSHPERGITPESLHAMATAELDRLRPGPGQPASLDFTQIRAVADAITAAYRRAGFPVATAVVPVQDIGPDRIVRLQVVEGRLGKVIVQGDSRYAGDVLAAPLLGLAGNTVSSRELSSAMLHARDIPGVSVSSTLVPGTEPGETDIILQAHDTRRPLQVSVSVNNHGTEQTGRGRAQLGLNWLSPLGLGDVFAASYTYAFDPAQSSSWAASYSVPVAPVPGLSLIAGASRGELEIRNGSLAVLGLSGPSSQAYLGGDWKFINTPTVAATASARYVREKSRIQALGVDLSNQKFDVVELGLSLRANETRSRAVNILRVSARKALDDDSTYPDFISGQHAPNFLLTRLDYLRLQPLSEHQRLLLRLAGQYTGDALIPMEQFGIGGADSVRAYQLNEAMGDRGWLASLQYQVDAPGFADKASPFGPAWGELLAFNLFADAGRTFAAGDNRGLVADQRLDGIGAGLEFRLPRFHNLRFNLSAATPIGGDPDAADGRSTRVFAQFALTF